MRVAIYVHDMRASGVVRAMIAVARSLAEAGDDIVLVAGARAGHFRAEDVAPAKFAAATERHAPTLAQLRIIAPLRRTLRTLGADVVLSGGNHGHFSVWAATRGLDVPLVLAFSNPMTRPGQPIGNRWRLVKGRFLVARSARSIVVGQNVAANAAFAPGIASGKAVLIHNGIDLAPARAAAASDSIVPPPMAGPIPVVLSVGRLHRQKNFEGLIDAVAAANRLRPLRLVVLGSGPDAYRAALVARAAGLGIADRVTFAGVTDDVFAWLRAARVFALASHYEGGPSLVLLEALAAGTPVVANCRGSDAPAVLADGRYGVLADAGDPAAFAAALLRQAGDDPVRPGDRAEAYDARAMVAAYRDVLNAAARGRRRRTRPSPSA